MAESVTDSAGRSITGKRPARAPSGRAVEPSRTRWWDTLASDITPAQLINYLSQADRGTISYQMQVFDRMVDRDPRLQAVVETRRLAITGVDYDILPHDPDDERAVRAMEVVREVLEPLEMDEVHSVLLDGVGKGVQVMEIIWNPDGTIAAIEEVSSRLLRWKDGVLEVNVSEGASPDYQSLEEWKFIVHMPRTKPGAWERAGLLRSLSILWVAKHWALRDWAAFTEVFGIPLRIGFYPDSATDDQISLLEDALKDLGSDAAAVVPDGMRLEFPSPSKEVSGSGESAMERFIGYIDKEYAIRLLGQNLTTEGQSGSGTLAGGAHDRVRKDYKRADAKALAATLRRDLYRPIVGFNLGWNYPLPRIWFDIEDSLDETARAQTYVTLGKLDGMTFSRAQIRNEFGLDEPGDEEDTIKGGSSNPLAGMDLGGFGEFGDTDDEGGEEMTTRRAGAFARSALSTGTRRNLKVAEKAAEEAFHPMQRILEFVDRLAEKCDTPEQLLTRIRLAAPDLEEELDEAGIDRDDVVDLLTRVMLTGEYNGRAGVQNELKVQR